MPKKVKKTKTHSWPRQMQIEAQKGRFVGRKEWVQSVADHGYRLDESARRFGINASMLSEFAILYGIKFNRLKTFSFGQLKPFVEKKASVSEIAEQVGCSRGAVLRALRQSFPDYTPPRRPAQPKRPPAEKQMLPAPQAPATALSRMIAMAAQENAALRHRTNAH